MDCESRSAVARPIRRVSARQLPLSIATLVIAAASQGELDPIQLRMVALAGFEICRPRGLAASASASTAP